jgi:hypothetical protein
MRQSTKVASRLISLEKSSWSGAVQSTEERIRNFGNPKAPDAARDRMMIKIASHRAIPRR